MFRRLPHIAVSLWLALTSLLPGQGWTLCVSPNGHVAVELVAPAGLPGEEATACREDCSEERCEACRDVSLAPAERACSRRDVVAVEIVATPVEVVTLPLPGGFALRSCSAPVAGPVVEAPHLTRVLRC